MVEVTLLEFNLPRENVFDLLSDLEKISIIHSKGSEVLSSPPFRMHAGQEPYKVNNITLYAKSKENIDLSELKQVVENNLKASVIIYREIKTGDVLKSYFLPEAINNNPYRRKLVHEKNIDKRLEAFK